MKIEAGKFYRTRDGRKVGPLSLNDLSEWPWELPGHSVTQSWRHDGSWGSHRGAVSRFDLVAEWVDDKPPAAALAEDYDIACEGAEDLTQTTFAPLEKLGGSFEARYNVFSSPGVVKPGLVLVGSAANTNTATGIASKAAELVGGDRDRQHGAKRDNFARIASVWNGWLNARKDPAAPLDAHDVGCMMAMMKLARTQSGALNPDDYIDACGYAACAGEVAQSAG